MVERGSSIKGKCGPVIVVSSTTKRGGKLAKFVWFSFFFSLYSALREMMARGGERSIEKYSTLCVVPSKYKVIVRDWLHILWGVFFVLDAHTHTYTLIWPKIETSLLTELSFCPHLCGAFFLVLLSFTLILFCNRFGLPLLFLDRLLGELSWDECLVGLRLF